MTDKHFSTLDKAPPDYVKDVSLPVVMSSSARSCSSSWTLASGPAVVSGAVVMVCMASAETPARANGNHKGQFVRTKRKVGQDPLKPFNLWDAENNTLKKNTTQG